MSGIGMGYAVEEARPRGYRDEPQKKKAKKIYTN